MSDIFICLSEENKGPSACFLARYRRSLRWPLEMNGVHVLYSLIIQLTASRKKAIHFLRFILFSTQPTHYNYDYIECVEMMRRVFLFLVREAVLK